MFRTVVDCRIMYHFKDTFLTNHGTDSEWTQPLYTTVQVIFTYINFSFYKFICCVIYCLDRFGFVLRGDFVLGEFVNRRDFVPGSFVLYYDKSIFVCGGLYDQEGEGMMGGVVLHP